MRGGSLRIVGSPRLQYALSAQIENYQRLILHAPDGSPVDGDDDENRPVTTCISIRLAQIPVM